VFVPFPPLMNLTIGISVDITNLSGAPDTSAIKAELQKKYSNGEMYIWEIPKGWKDAGQEQSEGILIKSDGTRIY